MLQGTLLAPAPIAAPAAAPEARRKKKTTRRVGYARDQAEDRPAERTASGSSSLASTPHASEALPSTYTSSAAAQSLPSKSATAAAAAAPPLLSAQPSPSLPPAVRTVAADARQIGEPVTTGSNGSPMPTLQEQAITSQPASPAKAAAAQSLPVAGSSPKRQHKAAISQAPPTVVQLASLSLPEAVATASLTTPAHVMLPVSSQGQKALPAAITAETLLQVLANGLFYPTC